MAGRPVEIRVASVSPATVRITVVPIGDPGTALGASNALVRAADAKPLTTARDAFAPIEAGNLRVRFTATPPTLTVEDRKGIVVQRLALDATAPTLSFALGKGPLLGFGEGGPQFDRKGQTYTNRNGQGGYQLRTHGGRVPIQWLVSTDGWGLYIHQPLGSFDLTGANGILTPGDAPLPIDRVRHRLGRSQGDDGANTRASPASRSCRRSGRSATCSRIARSPARTRSTGWRARFARRSCRATR